MENIEFKLKPNGVPRLSNKEIDEIAENIILDYNPMIINNPQLLDVDHFVTKYLGINQDYQYLTHDGRIWGMLVFNDTSKVPIYDPTTLRAEYIYEKEGTMLIDNNLLEETKEDQYRSTVMHEAGHWIFHKQAFAEKNTPEPLLQCRNMDIFYGKKDKGSKKMMNDSEWMEHHAKYFSASILMPKAAIQAFCNNEERKERIFRKFKGYENDVLICEVSKTFNVSSISASIRIQQLGLCYQSALFQIGY